MYVHKLLYFEVWAFSRLLAWVKPFQTNALTGRIILGELAICHRIYRLHTASNPTYNTLHRCTKAWRSSPNRQNSPHMHIDDVGAMDRNEPATE